MDQLQPELSRENPAKYLRMSLCGQLSKPNTPIIVQMQIELLCHWDLYQSRTFYDYIQKLNIKQSHYKHPNGCNVGFYKHLAAQLAILFFFKRSSGFAHQNLYVSTLKTIDRIRNRQLLMDIDSILSRFIASGG